MEPLSVGGVFDVCLHVFLACTCLNRFQLVVFDYDLQLSTVIFSNKMQQMISNRMELVVSLVTI